MKRLSKAQISELDTHVEKLGKAYAQVEEAWREFEAAHQEVASAVEAYNDAVQEAVGWRDDIVSQMQVYYDERSEKWQEGEAGEQYQAWIDEWESASIEEELECPELSELSEVDHADNLGELPQEVTEA